ncbi:MAG: 3-oxoacyl-[acyl-carrier protein] reductase [Subtercola sp.]|nr:3-oxoacyl-[acyl-carrier protein] reductase [Subtercola sp.]
MTGGLAGRFALITGAGGGLGQQIAELFARQGAIVGVNDIDRDKAEFVAERCRAHTDRSIAWSRMIDVDRDLSLRSRGRSVDEKPRRVHRLRLEHCRNRGNRTASLFGRERRHLGLCAVVGQSNRAIGHQSERVVPRNHRRWYEQVLSRGGVRAMAAFDTVASTRRSERCRPSSLVPRVRHEQLSDGAESLTERGDRHRLSRLRRHPRPLRVTHARQSSRARECFVFGSRRYE